MKCRRTACNNQDADCRHTQTGEMYCKPCALKINSYHRHINPPLISIPSSKGVGTRMLGNFNALAVSSKEGSN